MRHNEVRRYPDNYYLISFSKEEKSKMYFKLCGAGVGGTSNNFKYSNTLHTTVYIDWILFVTNYRKNDSN